MRQPRTRSARLLALVAPVVALATCLVTSTASAYVRSRTGSGTAVRFDSACVFLGIDTRGSIDVSLADVEATVDKSMSNWSGIAQCSYLELKKADPAERDARYDGKNVVQFLHDSWCHPADKNNPERCYDSAAAAITTVFFLDRPGEAHDGTIIDADIEVNEVNFTFVLLPSDKMARPSTATADLENTLTHEIGHLMGLDHTCSDNSTPANAVDQNGMHPVACSKLRTLDATTRATIENATMFNSAEPGETKKRSPEADDIAGICEAYPAGDKAPTRCAPVDLGRYTKGCQAAPGQTPEAGALLLGLLVAAVLLRPARRRG